MLYPPEGKVPERGPTETVRQQFAAELAHYLGPSQSAIDGQIQCACAGSI